jgi:glutamate synthase (NADPH/NADH) large chain
MSQVSSHGLHAPAFEHDSCGFGLIADLDDRPSRNVVDSALTALSRLAHRGAVGADGLSGDGCGLLLKRPEAFLRTLAAEAGLAPAEGFATGMLFLPHEADAATRCRAQLTQALAAQALPVAGWRAVPLDRDACGAIALAGLPRIEQVFVDPAPGQSAADFERALFLARRAAEKALADEPGFYVVTLSAASIGYKAMVLPDALARV